MFLGTVPSLLIPYEKQQKNLHLCDRWQIGHLLETRQEISFIFPSFSALFTFLFRHYKNGLVFYERCAPSAHSVCAYALPLSEPWAGPGGGAEFPSSC